MNILEAINLVDKIVIHCYGKYGEIFAASSVANFLKQTFPNKTICWMCSPAYKNLIDIIPYIDECHILNVKDIDDMFNKIHYTAVSKPNWWLQDNAVHLNLYRTYHPDVKQAFNEQFFSIIGDYNPRFTPTIKPDDNKTKEFEQWGNYILLFPFGASVPPLSWKYEDYIMFVGAMRSKGLNVVISGANETFQNIPGSINAFGIKHDIMYYSLSKAKAIVGVNSGIVFAAGFLGCNVLAMEDVRNNYMFKLCNINFGTPKRIYQSNRTNARTVAQFILSNL